MPYFFGKVSNSTELVGIDRRYSGDRFTIPFLGKVSNRAESGRSFFYGKALWRKKKRSAGRYFCGSVLGGENIYRSMVQTFTVKNGVQVKDTPKPPTYNEKTSRIGSIVVIQYPDTGEYQIIPAADLGMVRLNPAASSSVLWNMELCNYTGKYTNPNNEWAGVMEKGIFHREKGTRKFLCIIDCRRIGDSFSFYVYPRLVIKGKTGTDVLSISGVDEFSELLGRKTTIPSYVSQETLIRVDNRTYRSLTLTKKLKDETTQVMVNYEAGKTFSVPTGSTSNYWRAYDHPYKEIPDGVRKTFTPNSVGYVPVRSIEKAFYVTLNPYTEHELTVESYNAQTGEITFTEAPPPPGEQDYPYSVKTDFTYGITPIITYQYTSQQSSWNKQTTYDYENDYLLFQEDIDEHLPVMMINILKSDWVIKDISKKVVDNQGEEVVKEYLNIEYQGVPFDIISELHCQRKPPVELIEQICQAGALEYVVNPIILNRAISPNELPYLKNNITFRKIPLPSEYPEIARWRIPESLTRGEFSVQTDNVDKFNTINVIRPSEIVKTAVKNVTTVYEEITKQVPLPAPVPASPSPGSPNAAQPVYGAPLNGIVMQGHSSYRTVPTFPVYV
ncbi:MAG: hypothetical protein ABRQ37_11760 [Candidatus Eremiobacterota bacterium]